MVVLRSWTVPQQNQGWQPLKNEQSLSHLPPTTRLSQLDMTSIHKCQEQNNRVRTI